MLRLVDVGSRIVAESDPVVHQFGCAGSSELKLCSKAASLFEHDFDPVTVFAPKDVAGDKIRMLIGWPILIAVFPEGSGGPKHHWRGAD